MKKLLKKIQLDYPIVFNAIKNNFLDIVVIFIGCIVLMYLLGIIDGIVGVSSIFVVAGIIPLFILEIIQSYKIKKIRVNFYILSTIYFLWSIGLYLYSNNLSKIFLLTSLGVIFFIIIYFVLLVYLRWFNK